MKRVLIVSPHFPPTNAPDMQRVRMSLPYYRQFGWDPVVLAVHADDVAATQEPELSATVPAEVRVERVRALSRSWTRRLGVGTIGLRGGPALYAAGSRLLRGEKFDLVFFSNTQFVTFTFGRRWLGRFGVPYVIDMQDPWRTDYYERPGSRPPPGGWKYRFARLVARLEGWACRRAAGIMSVSPAYIETLRRRYPRLQAAPAAVIRFGGSQHDLEIAKTIASSELLPREPGKRHIVYTGAAGPIMPHAVTALFESLHRYRQRDPQGAERLRFHFFGTSYVPRGQGREIIRPIAAAWGVADQVREVPHRLGHLECLRLQSEADALLLPGSNDRDYSPSKVFPYYLSGKPILGLAFRDSVLERLLEELSCAYLVRLPAETNDAFDASLHRFFDGAAAGFPADLFPSRNEEAFRRAYLAEELTRQQCALFDRAVAYARPQ